MTFDVAILAKAPVPGFAKTRLIPALGPDGAAELQARLTRRAVATAFAAAPGRVTLWCAPDTTHPLFVRAEREGARLSAQPPGDLGARMLAAFAARTGPCVLIGTDCPALMPEDLREAAAALEAGVDVALCPAEDGGYGLIAARAPHPILFAEMPWGGDTIAALTRARARAEGLTVIDLRRIWDVDRPEDHARLLESGLLDDFPHP